MATYDTTLLRAALAIVAGIVAGASLVTLVTIVSDLQYFPTYGLTNQSSLIVFHLSARAWALGLVVVAPVPWAILHAYGFRSWQAALSLAQIATTNQSIRSVEVSAATT